MLALDLARTEDFEQFAKDLRSVLRETFGRDDLDALVNNAGEGVNAPYAETTEKQFDELIGSQLKGPFFLAQRLLPLVADGGRILNVSSGLARFTLPGYALYAAAKGGIEVLTRYQAKELGERGVRVGEAEDIGAGVAAILSDGFAWANGSRIELSGGQNV